MRMTMAMLPMILLGYSLGLLIAAPQLIWSWRYYRRSIRSSVSAQEKMAMGNVPLGRLLQSLVWTRNHASCDGVLYPEVTCYLGLIPLGLACLAPLSIWHGVLVLSALLALGRQTPLFRWSHRLHLRIPARYIFFLSLSLSFLTLEALTGRASRACGPLSPTMGRLLTLLTAWDLLLNTAPLMSHVPYLQRWDQPSHVCETPLTQFLRTHLGSYRVSGLPYPLRTGQIPGLHTLGYNGASRLRRMADWRPHEGGHDWFEHQLDGQRLNQYGIKFAYTYRPLPAPKWKPTGIPHLFENTEVVPLTSRWLW